MGSRLTLAKALTALLVGVAILSLGLVAQRFWPSFGARGGSEAESQDETEPVGMNVGAPKRLVSVDRAGTALPLIENTYAYAYPRFSPNGERLAVMVRQRGEGERVIPTLDGGADIWVLDFVTKRLRRVTADGLSFFPTWSPDGTQIAFVSPTEGRWRLMLAPVDASGDAVSVWESEAYFEPTAWSRTGERIFINLFQTEDLKTPERAELWVLRLPELRLEALHDAARLGMGAEFSPDGRWVSYRTQDGPTIAVDSLVGGSSIELGPGMEAAWDPSTSEVIVRRSEDVVGFAIATGPGASAPDAQFLFWDRFERLDGGYRNFAISGESGRFIFIEPVDRTSASAQERGEPAAQD